MNKRDLIEALVAETGIPLSRANQVVGLIFSTMAEALIAGDRIELRGFGSFTTKQYRSYDGRDPRTGKITHVPEKRLPFFKVGRDMKKRVDGPGVVGEADDSED